MRILSSSGGASSNVPAPCRSPTNTTTIATISQQKNCCVKPEGLLGEGRGSCSSGISSSNANRNYDSSLSNAWTVLQCPKCRFYWHKSKLQWLPCAWRSPDLVRLCLCQLPNNPLHLLELSQKSTPKMPSANHYPKIKKAIQKNTNIYKNVIHIQLLFEHRLSYMHAPVPWETDSTDTEEDDRRLPTYVPNCAVRLGRQQLLINEQETPQQQQQQQQQHQSQTAVVEFKENFYFKCKYRLCEACAKEHENLAEVAREPTKSLVPASAAAEASRISRRRYLSPLSFVQATVKQLLLLIPPQSVGGPSLSWPWMAPTVAMVEKGIASPLCRLDGDCCSEVVGFLAVKDLYQMALVSHHWSGLVVPELRQLTRFVEAWNDCVKSGVYVNLDNVCSSSAPTMMDTMVPTLDDQSQHIKPPSSTTPVSHDSVDITAGGYLQLLPVEEFRMRDPLEPCFITFNLQKAVATAARTTWQYVKPPAALRISGSAPTDDNEKIVRDSKESSHSITSTLLQCLPPRQQSLLAHLLAYHGSMMRSLSPVFSHGSILFPYIVSSLYTPPTPSPLMSTATTAGKELKRKEEKEFAKWGVIQEEPLLQHHTFHICFLFSC